jgi:hypothetical protein
MKQVAQQAVRRKVQPRQSRSYARTEAEQLSTVFKQRIRRLVIVGGLGADCRWTELVVNPQAALASYAALSLAPEQLPLQASPRANLLQALLLFWKVRFHVTANVPTK